MQKKRKIKISLFSGGSGNDRFIKLLSKINEIELNILVNGYDDGKSTGEIRKYIPEILGPSDFRKNFSHLIESNSNDGKIFSNILNFRFPNNISAKDFLSIMKLNKKNKFIEKLEIYNLSYEKFIYLKSCFLVFLKYYISKKTLSLPDLSLGNILIASLFLKNNKNFNKSLMEVQNLLDIKNNVLNITNGINLFLNVILENGKIITNEGELVSNKQKAVVKDIFLLKKKISKNKIEDLKKSNISSKLRYLKSKQVFPPLNKSVKQKLLTSDIIIYGPGTQYSSLFPSYITKDIRDIISRSKAKKFLITNIFLDNDIYNENVSSIISKFNYFFNKNFKKKINNSKLINYYLINKFDDEDRNLLKKDNYLIFDKKKNFTLLDWEKGEGLHYPNWLANKIFLLSNKRDLIKKLPKSVISIIVPCLNEKRTIFKVLTKLKNLKFSYKDFVLEIIIVDSGSDDGSINIISKFKEFKFYKLNNTGKGEALKFGINKSKGDIVVFFPSDNEYEVNDIEKVVQPIILNQSKVVLGSRMIKNILDDQLAKIYKNNFVTLFLSKYGGKLINLFILAFYNRSISDPFTSIKAFDSNTLKSINFTRKGFDLDFEILIKIFKKKIFHLEVPIEFKPRTPKQGKKITFIDGIKCLIYVIFSKIS